MCLSLAVAAAFFVERSYCSNSLGQDPGKASVTLFPLNPVGSARWYVTSGQWRADAATFAGMVHYLFEAEPPMPYSGKARSFVSGPSQISTIPAA
jgi:hypothetical protein